MVEDKNQTETSIGGPDNPIESEVPSNNGELSNDTTVITQEDITDTLQEKENINGEDKTESECEKCISLKKKVVQLQKTISRLRKNNRMLQKKLVENNDSRVST